MLLIFLLSFLLQGQSKFIQILNTESHDNTCYSQGLFFLNDTHLLESCGLYNESFFHILQYEFSPFSLKEKWRSDKPWKHSIFMEGMTLYKGNIFMLTWR